MKKSLLALAALTAFAGVASAQSSVTLFGIVDANLRNVKNGTTSVKSMSQDGIASSRIGLRGVEDLGGGLRAGFWIEGATNPDTGTPGGQTWQRRSTVSLLGSFGEVRLGRDYTPTFWNHTVFDPFGTNGVGSQTNLMLALGVTSVLGGGATTTVRANNSVGYFLPAMGGLYGQVMIAAGEGVAGNKYQGFRLGYAAGPVNVAFAWGKTEATPTRDMNAMNLAGSWNLGFMNLMGQWHNYKLDNTTGADPKQTNLMIGAVFPMGASTFKASYGRATIDTGVSGAADQKASQIAVGYQYDLSKRTALYTNFSRVSNDTGTRFAVGGPPTSFGGTATKPSSTGYEFGVRHAF
jgi:predicted porin